VEQHGEALEAHKLVAVHAHDAAHHLLHNVHRVCTAWADMITRVMWRKCIDWWTSSAPDLDSTTQGKAKRKGVLNPCFDGKTAPYH